MFYGAVEGEAWASFSAAVVLLFFCFLVPCIVAWKVFGSFERGGVLLTGIWWPSISLLRVAWEWITSWSVDDLLDLIV
jgi:hypothetical protein